MPYTLIVVGVSTGGLHALATILPNLPKHFQVPILVVQHMIENNDTFLAEYLNELCQMKVIMAEDKIVMKPGIIYISPPGYHMLVEDKNTLALSFDAKVNYSRPSIDVLFESAADIYKEQLVGVILTGANHDGVKGAKKIKENNGYIIVQSLKSAEAKLMPAETIKQVEVDMILDLNEIGPYLKNFNYNQ